MPSAPLPRVALFLLALARVAVVVPRTSWIPAGLQAHGAMDLHDPWKGLETAGDDTFAFQARAGVPEFRFAAPRDVAAAVNGWQPDAPGEALAAAPRGDDDPLRFRSIPIATAAPLLPRPAATRTAQGPLSQPLGPSRPSFSRVADSAEATREPAII